ncbi:MAG: AMP-binding protein [Nitriliruptor sp.]|uniref:AMP-binding protein n=1 Tax=Nitriliruptor sp. TaxID=2448056 RepID=UPI0034A06679
MRTPLTVADHLARAERVYPDRIGVVDEPEQPAPSLGSLSYRELGELARAQAAGLDALGIEVGDRVAVVSHNAGRLLTSFFGVCASGRVLVPVNFRLNPEEVGYILEHSGARVLLVDPDLEDVCADLDVEHRFVLGRDDDRIFRRGVEPRPWAEPDEDATATINYTSGTTARPKGVQMTHRNLWLNAATFGWHVGVSDRDVYLHTLPMFHANGWGMPFAVTAMGVPQIVLREVDGYEILRRVAEHGVTLLCGAPAVVAMVLDAAADLDEVPGRGRVRIVVAGAPPPTRTIERVETELGWEFVQLYGLTETAPLLTINRTRVEWDELSPADRAAKLVRAGVPAVGIDIAVDDEGEILARGNHILAGYWEQPDASVEALRDGWFHTGDGGAIDDEGYLSIVDRKKDVIISGGENVSSIEVEDTLHAHPGVAEVAVIGVPHERWGETVVALVVRAEGQEVSERELIDHCRERLAHYKCPTAIEFRDALDRTATGKLQKFKLRAPFWEGEDSQIKG